MVVLTPREYAVLRGAAEGLSTAEIAQRLGNRPGTVARQLHTAYQRLRARNRAHAVAILDRTERGWR